MPESVEAKVAKIANWIRKSRSKQPIREVVLDLIGDVPERAYMSVISVVFSGVEQGIRYTRDPVLNDVFEDPLWTAQVASGDCDAHTILIGSLLGSIGFWSAIRVVSYGQGPFSHVYPVVAPKPGVQVTPENAIPLDATLPGARVGYERPYVRVRTFKVDG